MSYKDFIGVKNIPKNYWDNFENIKNCIHFVFKNKKYEIIEDWYKISRKDIINIFGYQIFTIYKNVHELLNDIYKGWYVFYPWLFQYSPNSYWNNIENHKIYMDWLFKELKYESMEDWYKIQEKDLKHGNILVKYNNSPQLVVKNVYPEYNWLPWKFEKVPRNYWDNIENHKIYMDWLFKELKYESMEDWYKITQEIIISKNGLGILSSHYNNSCYLALKNIYPEYNWLPWKFDRTTRNYWDNIENHKIYMDWLFKELKYETMEDWYKLDLNDIKNNFGNGLITRIDNASSSNVCSLLKSIYPEYNWIPWKFNNVGNKYWNNLSNQRNYMDWLFKELKYETMEDWYKISSVDIRDNFGNGLLSRYGSMVDLIFKNYPEYNWDIKNFCSYKGENIIYEELKKYGKVIKEIYFDWCKNPKSKFQFPFDFCLEIYKIIIELDGKHHFKEVKLWKNNPEEIRERDVYKMKCALKNGYSIIRILWEDVYENKNSWKERLIEVIKTYDSPKIIYLSDKYNNYQEYKDFYEEICESYQ